MCVDDAVRSCCEMANEVVVTNAQEGGSSTNGIGNDLWKEGSRVVEKSDGENEAGPSLLFLAIPRLQG